MTARQKTLEVMQRLNRRGVNVNFEQAETLRRAEQTLHRWAEQKCGASKDRVSWAISRDENSNKPFCETHFHDGGPSRVDWIADREAGALRRIAAVCKAVEASFYHQTDPRGCALYVAAEPITDQNYSTHGTHCSV